MVRGGSSRKGFTLIEIMVVVVIISMVLMIVIPILPSSDQNNLKNSGRTLASTLRYLQERAAASGTGYSLTMMPGTEQMKISEVRGDGSRVEPKDPLLQKSPIIGGIVVADVRIPRLGKITEGEIRVDVGVGGIREFVTIHLQGSPGQFWTVMAYPSGRKIQQFPGYLEDVP